MKNTCPNTANPVPTENLWKVVLDYGNPFQMTGKSKDEVRRKCLDLGIGIYSAPIKSIEKISTIG